MNGIAVVENLDGLEPFLSGIRRLIKPDGQFLIDSTDLRPQRQDREISGSGDRYSGAAHLQLEYKNKKSRHFTQLYLNLPKNTPSIAVGLDGDEFGIVGASPTIN